MSKLKNRIYKYFQRKFRLSYLAMFLVSIAAIIVENIPLGNLDISLYRIIVIPVLGVTIFSLIRERKIIIPVQIIPLGVVLLIASAFQLQPRNYNKFIQIIFMLVLFIVAYNWILQIRLSKKTIRAISKLVIIISGIGAITLLTDYFSITNFAVLFKNSDLSVATTGRGAGIMGGESNFTASRFIILLPFIYYYINNEKLTFIQMVLGISTLVLVIFSLFLTGSRMGLIILGIQVILLLPLLFKKKRLMGKISIVLGIFSLIVLFASSTKFMSSNQKNASRLQSLTSLNEMRSVSYGDDTFDGSTMERFLLLMIGLKTIRDNPVLGVGLGEAKYLVPHYLPYIEEYKYLHNTYIELAADLGLIVLGFYLILLIRILLRIYQLYRKTSFEYFYYLGLSVLSLLLTWLFLSDMGNKIFWNLLLPIGVYLINTKDMDQLDETGTC